MTAREVVLEGGPPWGFRMHGGADVKQPLRISRVNPGSKAAHRGIREGDLISSINGQNTKELTNSEAHALLKNAGESLRLGLNEDTAGSPKRRQYRTIHQETLQETVKKSSVTTYSIQKTVETVETHPRKGNENTLSQTNEHIDVNGSSKNTPPTNFAVSQKSPNSSSTSSTPSTLVKEGNLTNTSLDNAEASQRSSYTNCTISPSTNSTLSEDGIRSRPTSEPNERPHLENTPDNMSDNGSAASKSKKRRQRRKNRKLNDGGGGGDPSPSRDKTDDVVVESKHVEEIKVSYRVDSPVEKAKKTPKLGKLPVKSKSLDDDEAVKIQELSETSETDEKDKDNKAIVSEASESETDKEEVADSKPVPPSKGTLSSLSLTLEEYNPDENALMSPEDEQKLRNFLVGLNLVSGPDEAARLASDKGNENAKGKKSQKRAALEQYFLPISQNPRFLDAISEEPSDRDSDREQPDLKQHLKRGTPEAELPGKPPAPPPRNKSKRKNFATPIQQPPAVLVDAKIVDGPAVTEGYISTSKAAEAASVEIVYLDSTESSSPADYDTISNDSYALDSQKSTSNEEISKEEVAINGISSSESDTIGKSSEDISNAKTEEKTSNVPNVKEKTDRDSTRPHKVYPIYSNVIVSNAQINNDINEKYESVLRNKNSQSNLTIVCRKDNGSLEKTYEELSGENETVTTSTSTKCSFVIKCDKSTDETDTKRRMIESGILSQLTPPPTPENTSPKNEANDLPRFVETDSSGIEEVVIHHGNTKSSIEIANHSKQNTDSSEKNNKTETKKNQSGSETTPRADSVEAKQNMSENKKSTETESQKGTCMKNQTPNKEIIGYKRYSDKIKTPSKEEDAKKETGIVYTNVISPPPPSRSPSMSSSSSVDSSLCTAKYNPLSSSIADVASIAKDEDLNKESAESRPTSLREICLNFLLSLPFGADVLQELADVSESIESYTNNLPSKILPKLIPNLPAFVNKPESDSNNDSCKLSVRAMPVAKEWVGIPTEKDPRLLMCVSPKQKEELEKSEPVTDEAGKLIDLHEKFVNRRHQEEVKKETEEKVTITNVSRNAGNVSVASPTGNRLLEIIREEPATVDENYIYFAEREPADVGATLPRPRDSESARLKAKNLSEWLDLARDKSMSESNLSSAADIPENNLRKDFNAQPTPRRRTSLPHDLFARQMIYLQEKEREIQRQLERLEDEKRRLNAEIAPSRQFQPEDYRFSRKGDFAESKNAPARPTSMPAMPTEFFRQQMYEEYMDKFAEREDRRQNKVIKVTSSKDQNGNSADAGNEAIRGKEIVHPIHIEKEFLEKVKQKQEQGKLGKNRESVGREGSLDKEREEEEPVLVMDGDKLRGAKQLPKHLQEFVSITKQVADGVWAPGQRQDVFGKEATRDGDKEYQKVGQDEAIPPVWTPKSANSSPTVERKEFRPVNFQSPVLGRKARTKSENFGSDNPLAAPPWKVPDYSSDTGIASSLEKRLPTSHSSPASGFGDLSTSPRLPKAQNPTITLLQKAREGQLPRGAAYIDSEQKQYRPRDDRPPIASPSDILYQIKSEYTSESESERPRKMADLGPRKYEGIGPVSKDGMPLILRSEIKDQNQSKWYKRMYDTIHKQKPHNDEFVTIRYRQRRAQYPYTSGYLSEPEPGAYDSDFTDYKYLTMDRRRPATQEKYPDYATSSTMPRSLSNRSSSSAVLRSGQEPYRVQPGRIENYTPGHSSISEKEAKEWWDEVMDIFDGHLEQQKRVPPSQPRSFINQALKESGYESDSTLVFRRREEAAQQLSPKEQKEAYKVIQKGGDVPLHGLRKPAPERPKEKELVEFFPISPTLTRIRIHKNVKPQKEIICYPVTVHHNPNTFSAYKRTAPSSATPSKVPTPPPIPAPSPPRRKSSRNNPTLRLVSTMKLRSEKSPICKRHETCFTSSSDMNKTKVNYLRDKITCKLSPHTGKRSESPKIRVVKKITTTPELKNKITSTLSTSRDPKTSARRVQSKTNIHSCVGRSKSTESVRSPSKASTITRRSPTNASDESLNLRKSPARTFGTEKRKFDLNLSDKRSKIDKSPDLLSPTEVKKAVLSQSKSVPPGTVYKKTNAVLSSTKTNKLKEVLPIKVGISEKARGVLRSNLQRPASTSPRLAKRASPCPSLSSDRSRTVKTSLESLGSPKMSRKPREIAKSPKPDVAESKKTQKSKKEQINDEIAKKGKIKKDKVIDQSKKCLGRAEGTEVMRRLRNIHYEDDIGSTLTVSDIEKQKQVIESNQFFRHLFLRDLSPTPSSSSRSNWLIEKTNQLSRRKSSSSEPSIGAMKVYLKHTKPVTDSKFISLDIERVRSRSASPKSVTFENAKPYKEGKRSSSLPPKLIFSQTSRPVSPVVYHRRMISPPPSPKLSRSPSCRKIMHFKHLDSLSKSSSYTKIPEYSLYMCPSLNQSTTSIDSLKSEDYQRYFHELVHATRKCDKFKDLNQFYSGIEKLGELERAFCLKPRKKGENEIIDFDRWKEVRTRERAEQELKALYHQIKENEKEKGFLYLPKDVSKYKWKREYDRGLRIKEKSVDNIKEEFERIKLEESDRENARRRELAYSKDVYKPLWRGSSVVNLANSMAERRSQSEGRIKTARQKLVDSERLLTRGIGSRIWSSLSMEQVNILKEQLAEIYNHHPSKDKPEYYIQVPQESKQKYPSSLTVRRNSDSSERVFKIRPEATSDVSEDHKKMISQTLSKELLEKIAKRRKENKTALPLVVGKEILGAVAAAGANVKSQQPVKPLIKTDAVNVGNNKVSSTSENDSGSTDDSTKTVIYVGAKEDIKKKVEYFEKVKDADSYTPTIYRPAESTYDMGDVSFYAPKDEEDGKDEKPKIFQSKSCQDVKEYFGEKDLVKFATIPLSATRKHKFSPKKPELRALEISPLRSDSSDSLRSRSISPFLKESQALVKAGKVNRLKNKFEYMEDFYGSRTLKRSRSESDLQRIYSCQTSGYVDSMKRKYEYPAYSGRGRSRTRRGGVVSPIFLRAEDRFMPHINIISKIASLYTKKGHSSDKETSRSTEELAEILGCPVGEVEKLREKFDGGQDDASFVERMYTSSPSIRELKDIAPYLTANWIAHRYPKFEDNARSLSSPETASAARDAALVKRSARPKSSSPSAKPKKSLSILKPMHRNRSPAEERKYDPQVHEPVSRYQPSDPSRYRSGWSAHLKPSVSFKDPEPPVPPPKGHHARNFEPESPRKYVENEVTIHYKTPIRQEVKEYLSEDELAYRQAEAMKKIYQEERRKKYLQVSKSLQELQDMNSRRHTDNFIPSQKSPISLNRYDDFDDLAPSVKPRPRSPEPRLVARALYNFVGQTARELTFRKGDLIYVRRQVDKNWYEGELNAMVGLFPTNYVEIVPYDGMKTTPRKAHEGQARAKYNFVAQTHLELSLAKGELVVITRRVDDNWFEGKIGGRKGIFPASYVEVLIDPQEPPSPSSKPVAAPAAHSLLLNGSAGGKESMGSHCYTPSLPNPQLTPSYHAKPVQVTAAAAAASYGSLGRPAKNPMSQTLHIDTQNEPVPYRALYKYKPQNDDELELLEGDTVYVLEKCDDGWFVGSSDRTGAFGTFPGNYVEKI